MARVRRRKPARWGRALVFLVALLAGVAALDPSRPAGRHPASAEAIPRLAPPAAPAPSTLILYTNTGPWGDLGELYAIFAANLAGHFGTYEAKPVSAFAPGDLDRHTATIFIGSTFEEKLPRPFLEAVAHAQRPVLWMQYGIDQLARATPDFADRFGWLPTAYDPPAAVAQVRYKGVVLTRQPTDDGGVTALKIEHADRVDVVAQAVRAGGREVPWAVRSGNLTYIGENPFSYMSETDRYLILSDLMFDLVAPKTPERHRALIRIEDVSPASDPAKLKAIADYLYAQQVPFSVALIDTYADPLGVETGKPRHVDLAHAPKVVAALRYMAAHGGTLIMHGHTHQAGRLRNPYDAITGDDFEFYRAHVDAQNYVRYDGPLAEDSTPWALSRIDEGLAVWAAAGLPAPRMFEFPHYAGSAADYAAVQTRFGLRYDRAIYFRGTLSGHPDARRQDGQFFPYPLRDVYGSWVIPENLGNLEQVGYNHNTSRTAAQIVEAARLNLVVRDGFASFFYHAYLGPTQLAQIVPPIKAMGYQFVAPSSLTPDPATIPRP